MSVKEKSHFGKILYLLREIHVSPWLLTGPVILSLIAAAFEGVGMGLLIPLLSGFLQKDFSFLRETPVISNLIALLPTSIVNDDKMLFVVLILGFISVYILKNVFRYFAGISVGYFAERSMHHLRKTLFVRYMSFGKLFFDSTNVGHHNTLLNDFTIQALRPFLSIHKYMNAIFSLAVYFIVMLSISVHLTLFALPLFVILHFSIRGLILTIKNLSRSIAQRAADLGKKSVEILSTIPLVKAHRTEALEQKHYTEISNQKAQMDFRVRVLSNLILPVQESLTIVVACAIFLSALYFIGRDNIGSEPAFIVYFYVVLNASQKFGILSTFRGMLASCTGPLDEVLEVFSTEGKYQVPSGPDEFIGIEKSLEFSHLTFSYGDREVLHDISVTIPKGKMTAIVGPTGAGKSTFINLIMRYYDCPSNSILIDGKDVRDFSLDSYLGNVALVSQETYLLHDSLRSNIVYGLEGISDEAINQAVEQSRLSEYIAQLPQGLDTLVGDRGVKLSGGEKQRVSIARTLLKGAELLILDEATSSLDSTTEHLIQEAIDEAIKDRTSIVIAHRLSTIAHADSIIVLEDGKIVEQGTMQELIDANGKFKELWEQQMF